MGPISWPISLFWFGLGPAGAIILLRSASHCNSLLCLLKGGDSLENENDQEHEGGH